MSFQTIDPHLLRTTSALRANEQPWADLAPFFDSKGYEFRSRYRTFWTPSWINSGRSPLECEDFHVLPLDAEMMDATRKVDGKFVCIKRAKTGSREVEIAIKYSTPPLSNDPANHFAPALEVLRDLQDKSVSYIITPLCRKADDPSFEVVGDIVDFATQLFEGLAFMHGQNIAHRNLNLENLVMDASAMYPKGFHPIETDMKRDLSGPAKYTPRHKVSRSVKYYFFDFAKAVEVPPTAASRFVTGSTGFDSEAPELVSGAPYDPFKLDVFDLGIYFQQSVLNYYSDVRFLAPLTKAMTAPNPAARPDATTIMRQWTAIKGGITAEEKKLTLRTNDASAAYTSFL